MPDYRMYRRLRLSLDISHSPDSSITRFVAFHSLVIPLDLGTNRLISDKVIEYLFGFTYIWMNLFVSRTLKKREKCLESVERMQTIPSVFLSLPKPQAFSALLHHKSYL